MASLSTELISDFDISETETSLRPLSVFVPIFLNASHDETTYPPPAYTVIVAGLACMRGHGGGSAFVG